MAETGRSKINGAFYFFEASRAGVEGEKQNKTRNKCVATQDIIWDCGKACWHAGVECVGKEWAAKGAIVFGGTIGRARIKYGRKKQMLNDQGTTL
jgi:hypothetical protein